VSDATAASKDRNNPIFCAVLDAAVTSNTENHGSCKLTFNTVLQICSEFVPNGKNRINPIFASRDI
jgi:hypothetical protein